MFGTVAIPMGDAPGYAELHCHTNFSFLDGASHPDERAGEAARLGLAGLAATDHDGLYGAVRFALAAREFDLPTVFGAAGGGQVEFPGGKREAHRAVEAVVVGGREAGQPEPRRLPGPLVRVAGAVEEGEVGVAVQLRIARCVSHGDRDRTEHVFDAATRVRSDPCCCPASTTWPCSPRTPSASTPSTATSSAPPCSPTRRSARATSRAACRS